MSFEKDFLNLLKSTTTFVRESETAEFVTPAEFQALYREPMIAEPKPSNPTTLPFKPAPSPVAAAQKELKALLTSPVESSVMTVSKSPKHGAKPETDAKQIRSLLGKIAPSLSLAELVPEDHTAKKVLSSYQENLGQVDVVLISFEQDEATLNLLKNLAKAIDQKLGKAKLIAGARLEREKRWDTFLEQNPVKLIIATAGISHFNEIMRYYSGHPATGEAYLGKIPLLTLQEASAYDQPQENKAALWKHLCQLFNR